MPATPVWIIAWLEPAAVLGRAAVGMLRRGGGQGRPRPTGWCWWATTRRTAPAGAAFPQDSRRQHPPRVDLHLAAVRRYARDPGFFERNPAGLQRRISPTSGVFTPATAARAAKTATMRWSRGERFATAARVHAPPAGRPASQDRARGNGADRAVIELLAMRIPADLRGGRPRGLAGGRSMGALVQRAGRQGGDSAERTSSVKGPDDTANFRPRLILSATPREAACPARAIQFPQAYQSPERLAPDRQFRGQRCHRRMDPPLAEPLPFAVTRTKTAVADGRHFAQSGRDRAPAWLQTQESAHPASKRARRSAASTRTACRA